MSLERESAGLGARAREDGPEAMLIVEALEARRNGKVVLAVPRLKVQRGETLAVIGPNGAGKSTLLLALALLLNDWRGTIWLGGEAVTPANAERLRRRLAVVFQEPLLLDTTVANNVATGLTLRGVAREEREVRVKLWLERFGIGSLANRRSRSISGGEAQRTSLARALATEPELLLLDELFSALDMPTREAVTADLLQVLRSTRTTTVLVTHDRDEALMFGNHLAVLMRGQLRQVDTPEKVFATPSDVDVASFVGIETIAPGVVVGQEQGLALIRVGERLLEVTSALRHGTQVFFCLLPEDVTLHLSAGTTDIPASSARNRLTGRVESVSPWGGQVRVVVDCGFRLSAQVTRRSATELGIAEGAEVVAAFKATSAHLLERA